MKASEFKTWRESNFASQSDCAVALGLKDRVIIWRYETERQKIPEYIRLAVIGWNVENLDCS